MGVVDGLGIIETEMDKNTETEIESSIYIGLHEQPPVSRG